MSAHPTCRGGVTSQLFRTREPAAGLLVTIDGPNGSGKTSIAREIAQVLGASGQLVLSTQQPSSSPVGTMARTSEATLTGRALACLVAADRHHQLATEILPALRRGAIVVCDRYVESSLVLQRIDGVEPDFILSTNSGIERPDLRVRLLASEQALAGRLAKRELSPERRFEGMAGGPARELELYAEADKFLSEEHELPSLSLDTTSSVPVDQANFVIKQIRQRLKGS
jgi:dTMP kinase